MEVLNHREKAFVEEWCKQTHTTTKRIPNQHYLLEEKKMLGTLPTYHLYQTQLKQRKVSPNSFVSFTQDFDYYEKLVQEVYHAAKEIRESWFIYSRKDEAVSVSRYARTVSWPHSRVSDE